MEITPAELLKYGILPDLQPLDESSEGLIELFQQNKLTGQQILIPRSEIALPVLPKGLEKSGNHVTTLTVYENVMPEKVPKVLSGTYDYIVFNSPSGVDNFFRFHNHQQFHDQKFIVRGNETLKRISNYNFPNAHVKTTKAFEYETIS